jgi:hypothetical protein
MRRPASATRVAGTGNEGNAHVRRNKLQTQRISGHGSEQLERIDGKKRERRTLWVRFARASPLLPRRFQRASVSLGRTEFMRMRLVRLVAIILRERFIHQDVSERASSPYSRRVTSGCRRGREKPRT